MKVKQFLDKILQNWPAKVICFVMALFLYIFHQVSLLDRKTFMVPLAVQADGQMLPVSQYPGYVKVTVRARPDAIASVLSSDIKAELNLDTYSDEGVYSVPVTLNIQPRLLMLDPFEVSVKPEYVNIRIEEKILKYINLEPSLSGEAEHGYTVSGFTVTPPTVAVTGPRSIVENLSRIYTDKIDITGISADTVYQTRVDNINSLIRVEDIDGCSVALQVTADPLTKTLANVQIKAVNLAETLQLTEKLPTVSFEITGTVPQLESFVPDDKTVYVDCGIIKEPGSYELPVRFALPDGVTPENNTVEAVRVEVKEKTVHGAKTEDPFVRDSLMNSNPVQGVLSE